MASRYCSPIFLSSLEESRGQALERIPFQEAGFSEAQLQEWLFNNPESLPMRQIDPSFGPVTRLCQELPVGDNYLDLAYVNETGRLMLVECKLWRNPQSRREVIRGHDLWPVENDKDFQLLNPSAEAVGILDQP